MLESSLTDWPTHTQQKVCVTQPCFWARHFQNLSKHSNCINKNYSSCLLLSHFSLTVSDFISLQPTSAAAVCIQVNLHTQSWEGRRNKRFFQSPSHPFSSALHIFPHFFPLWEFLTHAIKNWFNMSPAKYSCCQAAILLISIQSPFNSTSPYLQQKKKTTERGWEGWFLRCYHKVKKKSSQDSSKLLISLWL